LRYIVPKVFLSYSRTDADMARRIRNDLEQSGIDCWLDTVSIWAHDRFRETTLLQEIPNRDLFVGYITEAYADSEWCQSELAAAIKATTIEIALLAESKAAFDGLDERIREKYQCDVLEGRHDAAGYHRSMLRLTSAAWASLQSKSLLVPGDDHIRAGANVVDEEGSRQQDLMADATQHLILAGANLRGWLSSPQTRERLVARARDHKRVTLILTTYDAIRPLSPEGETHLRQSVAEIRDMRNELDGEDGGRYLAAHFHVGAATLSAVFVDPDAPNGRLYFTPRWAMQVIPEERMTCVIDKRVNSTRLFRAIYGSVLNMTQADAESLDAMEDKL
jgi:hypothetical protein